MLSLAFRIDPERSDNLIEILFFNINENISINMVMSEFHDALGCSGNINLHIAVPG